jgi:hypothetical protein
MHSFPMDFQSSLRDIELSSSVNKISFVKKVTLVPLSRDVEARKRLDALVLLNGLYD